MSTPNAVIPVFSLGNDKPFVARLFKSVSGKVVGLDAGNPVAFLSTDPTADDPSDPALTCSITHILKESWEVIFDTSAAKDDALTAIGTNTPLYLIIIHPDGVRVVAQCVFDPILYAKVTK
jgi:hypothetical protein